MAAFHLNKATLLLVHSTAECCALIWCRSAHTRLIDIILNDALHIVTGCLHPIPTDHPPVLSSIQPAELCRMKMTLSLAYRGSLDSDHILYGLLSEFSDTRQVRLRSRRPFVPAAQNLLDNLARLGICASEWTNHKWNVEYPKQLGLSSTACGLVLGDSIHPFTNGVHSFTELQVWRL